MKFFDRLCDAIDRKIDKSTTEKNDSLSHLASMTIEKEKFSPDKAGAWVAETGSYYSSKLG